jgi:DNA repair photolyase
LGITLGVAISTQLSVLDDSRRTRLLALRSVSEQSSARRLPSATHKGRGAGYDPSNRFRSAWLEPEPDWTDPEDPGPQTRFLSDASRTVISKNTSPDVPFDVSINPYRGCEHGCVYCYARPTHEYLDLSAGLDFETRIVVKREAPRLLRDALAKPSWRPRVLAMSGVTDAYQPVERRLRLTRGCLEVLVECRNPVAIVTKSHLVTRDVDLLGTLAQVDAAHVLISVTSLDERLVGALEPRAARPQRRLAAIRALRDAGVPVGVMVAPVIPGLNDREVPAILEAAAEAGATTASWILLRLPHAVAPLFEDWLGRHAPEARDRVMARIRETRGGHVSDARFGARMRGEGAYAAQLESLFRVARRRAGLAEELPPLSCEAFRRPLTTGAQLSLFGG